MGIIVNDEYETQDGVTLNSHYVCINEMTQEKRGPTAYMIFIKVKGYVSKEAKESGKRHIYEQLYGDTSNVPVNEKMYDYCYDIVKRMYTSYTDELSTTTTEESNTVPN